MERSVQCCIHGACRLRLCAPSPPLWARLGLLPRPRVHGTRSLLMLRPGTAAPRVGKARSCARRLKSLMRELIWQSCLLLRPTAFPPPRGRRPSSSIFFATNLVCSERRIFAIHGQPANVRPHSRSGISCPLERQCRAGARALLNLLPRTSPIFPPFACRFAGWSGRPSVVSVPLAATEANSRESITINSFTRL